MDDSVDPLLADMRARYSGKTYYQQIAQYLEKSTVAYPMCLEFRSLQGINILHLQKLLLKEYQRMLSELETSEEQLQRVQELFAKYSDAIKNFEDMCARDVVDGTALSIHVIIFPELAELNQNRSYPLSLRKIAKGRHALSKFREEAEQVIRRQQLRREWIDATKARLIWSISGGLLLIVPMLIMALVRSQTASLITSSSAVLIFALAVAGISSAKPQELLAATAAYAAVLVVFVGTSQSQIAA
jgi:VIT1/CCC1 family predicted Fe2+/Mn2+ transporter